MNIVDKIVSRIKEFLQRKLSINSTETELPWWKRNYERYTQTRRVYMAKNATRLKLYNQEWHRKHSKEVSERKRKWYIEHQDEIREYNRQWRANNPDKIREYTQRQYDRKKEITKGEIQALGDNIRSKKDNGR